MFIKQRGFISLTPEKRLPLSIQETLRPHGKSNGSAKTD